jgi:integrase/recombinase XerD
MQAMSTKKKDKENGPLRQYLEKRYAPPTVKTSMRAITAYLGNVPSAKKAAYGDIVRYIGQLRGRYSNPSTITNMVCGIKAYHDYLCHTGQRTDNPAKLVKLRDIRARGIQLQDLFTGQELEGLQRPKKRNSKAVATRDRVLLSLVVNQALRPAEIEALQTVDIDLAEATVHVRASGTHSGRTLALKATQVMELKGYIDGARAKLLKGKQSGQLAIGQLGNPMKAEDISKNIARLYGDTYSPRTVNAQTIRQSVIANLLKQGNDLRIVQAFAGHKHPMSTERYRQDGLDALKTAIARHHPIR